MSSSHPEDKQLLHKNKDGRTRNLSKTSRRSVPGTDRRDVFIFRVWRFGRRCKRNQITDVITAGGQVHESDLFTSGEDAFPLSLSAL